MPKHIFCCQSLLLFMLLSCHNRENPTVVDGGPCTYSNIPFKAVISSMHMDSGCLKASTFPAPSCTYKVWIKTPVLHEDSVELGTVAHKEVTSEMISKLGLKPGRQLEGVLASINSGTCTPEIYQFKDSLLNGW